MILLKKLLVFTIFCTLSIHASTQMTMHNFNVTDAHGKTHKLYEDYLANNKVVVLKFFFTTCPPCIANAPLWEEKYKLYGSGKNDVEFFSVTTLSSDSNSKVADFETFYDQTMKGIGNDGNAPQIVDPFKIGTYGSWWGTPSFAVIGPNKTLVYPVFFNGLDEAIQDAKGQITVTIPPSKLDVQIVSNNYTVPSGDVKFYLKPKDAVSPKIEITKNGDGKYLIDYPSLTYPEMVNPEVVMESVANAYTSTLTAADLVVLQKHLLGITIMVEPYKLLAADVNSDGKLTANDILQIRKVILGLITDFPNNTPSYKSIPEKISVVPSPGNIVPISFTIVKVGNLN